MLSKTHTTLNFDLNVELNRFCNQFIMSDNAHSLLAKHTNLDLFLSELIEQKCYSDAILLIIYRLNQNQAIQWACAAITYLKKPLSDQDQLTLNAVATWLQTPSETNRQKTLNITSISAPNSVNWAAVAAYWAGSETSEAEENAPQGLIQDAVYSSIMQAILQTAINDQETTYKNTINTGLALLC